MRVPNRSSIVKISILGFLGMATAMGFNSCSEVEFSKATGNSQQCSGPSCPSPGPTPTPGPGPSPTPIPTPTPMPPANPIPHQDAFTVPAGTNKADVLLVLDNSGSMSVDLEKLADKLDGLIAVLDTAGVDWKMCYISTSDTDGEARNWTTGSKVLLPTTTNKRQVFLNSINGLEKNGNGYEQGIRTTRVALENSNNSSCFRSDAALSVVIVSDEDEASCGGRCQNWTKNELGTLPPNRSSTAYRDQYHALTDYNSPENLVAYVDNRWPEHIFVVSTIVIRPGDNACYQTQDSTNPAFFGIVYASLQRLTGGVLGDICAADYASQLQAIGQRTADTISSVTLACEPAGTPTVTINPKPAGQTHTVNGNKIVFNPPLTEGTQVTVDYICDGI